MRGFLIHLSIGVLLFISACTLGMSPMQSGQYYLSRKNYPAAVKAFENAANAEGDMYYYLEAYAYLGDAYSGNGRVNDALSVYRNAMQIINLRLREISARRHAIRKELGFRSDNNYRTLQEEDMRLADEEWKLKEREADIKEKIGSAMELIKVYE